MVRLLFLMIKFWLKPIEYFQKRDCLVIVMNMLLTQFILEQHSMEYLFVI